MEKLEVTVIDGGLSGIDPATMKRILDAAHSGEEVLISVNLDGVIKERILREDERELLRQSNTDDRVSFSVRSHGKEIDGLSYEGGDDTLLYDHNLPSILVGYRGRGNRLSELSKHVMITGGETDPLTYNFRRLLEQQHHVEMKKEPFRGRERKQIPPRSLKVQRRR